VFGQKDGVVSCRYIRNQINAGAVKREVPLTARDIQFINNYTVLHSRTGFVDGPAPHQKRHMLRLWLKFPKKWPLGPDFPSHLGYTPAQDTPILAEAEA
jgi:hypothetical protein